MHVYVCVYASTYVCLCIFICGFCMTISVNNDYFWASINKMIPIKVKYGVFFEAWAEFLNII
jgi:hypothetical protein